MAIAVSFTSCGNASARFALGESRPDDVGERCFPLRPAPANARLRVGGVSPQWVCQFEGRAEHAGVAVATSAQSQLWTSKNLALRLCYRLDFAFLFRCGARAAEVRAPSVERSAHPAQDKRQFPSTNSVLLSWRQPIGACWCTRELTLCLEFPRSSDLSIAETDSFSGFTSVTSGKCTGAGGNKRLLDLCEQESHEQHGERLNPGSAHR